MRMIARSAAKRRVASLRETHGQASAAFDDNPKGRVLAHTSPESGQILVRMDYCATATGR